MQLTPQQITNARDAIRENIKRSWTAELESDAEWENFGRKRREAFQRLHAAVQDLFLLVDKELLKHD